MAKLTYNRGSKRLTDQTPQNSTMYVAGVQGDQIRDRKMRMKRFQVKLGTDW